MNQPSDRQKTIVLDHVRGIELPATSAPLGNLQALFYLQDGLRGIAEFIRQQEIAFPSYFGGRAPLQVVSSKIPNLGLLSCQFNWFSVSLVSYLRLVRLVDVMILEGWGPEDLSQSKNAKKIKDACVEYVEDVAPDIYLWRNKIGAHFAATDPRSTDNMATLEVSLAPTVTYSHPHLVAGAVRWTRNNVTSTLRSWSVTAVFESLAPRLWPESNLPQLTASTHA